MSRLLDTAMEVGIGCDWITPLWALVHNRPSKGFIIPMSTGVTAGLIEDLLKRRNIDVWGIMIDHNDLMFRVRESDADDAQSILEHRGIVFKEV